MNIKWDAKKYEAGFSFVHRYGEELLDMLGLPEGSRVIDLGCGNGALTAKLAERGYEVTGIDDSEEMLELARSQYPDISFKKGDAGKVSFGGSADGVFSNAVFHWIDDAKQDGLLNNISSQLADGGVLVCEFGGSGNAETVHAALESAFQKRGYDYPRTFYFPTIGEYAPRMEHAGFRMEEAYLFDRPTPQQGDDGLSDWIRMFCKRAFDGMNDAEAEAIISEAAEACRERLYVDGVWYVDYVRLRIKASIL